MADDQTEQIYKQVAADVIGIDARQSLIRPRGLASGFFVDASVAKAYRACLPLGSLDAHENAIRAACGTTVADAGSLLATLQGKGLLLRLRKARPPQRAIPIRAIGVVTADRPSMVQRCVESLLKTRQEYGAEWRLVILDGSSTPAASHAIRRTVSGRAYKSWVRHLDRPWQDRLARHLVAAGTSSETIEFALRSGPDGNNRNLLLLATAGQRLLCLDDDVILAPRQFSGRPLDGLDVWGHREQRHVRVFKTRHEAIAATQDAHVDLVAEHARLLGQPVRALRNMVKGHPATDGVCSHLVEQLESDAAKVAVTFTGVVGDAGIACPYRRLFANGALAAELERATETPTALESREIACIARRYSLTHGASFMTHSYGIDNTAPLLPFMPLGRNTDGLYGTVLSQWCPERAIVHLPYGIIHDSSRPAAFETDEPLSATRTRLADILVALCNHGRHSSAAHPDAAACAGFLHTLGSLADASFAELVRSVLLGVRLRELAVVNKAIDSSLPESVKTYARRYRTCLLVAMQNGAVFVPAEFSRQDDRSEATKRLKRFVSQYARLMMEWPDLWSSALRFDEEA